MQKKRAHEINTHYGPKTGLAEKGLSFFFVRFITVLKPFSTEFFFGVFNLHLLLWRCFIRFKFSVIVYSLYNCFSFFQPKPRLIVHTSNGRLKKELYGGELANSHDYVLV